MSRRRASLRRSYRPALLLVLLATCFAGCGVGSDGETATVPGADASAAAAPALLTAPAADGEVVVHGQASPATHGPYAFHGRYLVRFQQYAPEDPQLDFAQQTSFVAQLRDHGAPRAPAIRLFREAARSGRRVLAIDGRYDVEVSFGDFPYVVRFTPR